MAKQKYVLFLDLAIIARSSRSLISLYRLSTVKITQCNLFCLKEPLKLCLISWEKCMNCSLQMFYGVYVCAFAQQLKNSEKHFYSPVKFCLDCITLLCRSVTKGLCIFEYIYPPLSSPGKLEIPHKLFTERSQLGFEAATFLLQGSSADHQSTILPTCCT